MKKFLITLFSLVCVLSVHAGNAGTSTLGTLCGDNQKVNDFCEPGSNATEGNCHEFMTKNDGTKLICAATKCDDGYLLWLNKNGESMGQCHSAMYANLLCEKGCGCRSDEKCVPWIVDTPKVKVNGQTFEPKKDGAYRECHCVPGAEASQFDAYVPDEELSTEIEDITTKYFEGRFDFATATAVCVKVFDYANAHGIKIYVKEADGKTVSATKKVCDTSRHGSFAMPMVISYILTASNQIKAATIEPHSVTEQYARLQTAETKCIGAGDIDNLKRRGYDTYSAQSVVECSDTDRRCVVSMPIKKDDTTSFFTACCMVDVSEVMEHSETHTDKNGTYTTTVYDGHVGSVSVYDRVTTSNALKLSNFGYDCKYKR